jgi:BirA family biotin operon repressor/biotin-[acetyl-CoA-carboxylase] ligase
LTIYSFETLPSTQTWLIGKVKEGSVDLPCAVIAEMQTDGIGSRENRWIGKKGNFFASVAIDQSMLPDDLPVSATSIYFAFLMKKTVEKLGSGAWVKWPNDLYLQERKIGGCITAKKGDVLIAGIGVNIVDAPLDFGILDLDIAPLELLKAFLRQVESAPSWKQIFSNFSLEFEKSKRFHTHVENETLDLTDAVLNEDGSLMIGKRRVVSLR